MKRVWPRAVLGLFLFGVLVYAGLFAWVAARVNGDQVTRANAVIVLGAQAYFPPGRWNPCLVARVERGVELIQAGYAPRIVFSGGVDKEDGAVEAKVMLEIAKSFGLSPEQALLEPRSTSTAENLRFSSELLDSKRVIIVSDPFHLARAGALAAKLGLQATLVPAPRSPCWSRFGLFSRFTLREPLAIVENWFRGDL